MLDPRNKFDLSLDVYFERLGTVTIYLDHQASTPILPSALDAMQPFWTTLHGNPHSSEHSTGWSAHKAAETSRSKVAGLLRVDPDEIVFTSGATEANNLAIKGLGKPTAQLRTRKRILVSTTEHKCVIESASYIARVHDYTLLQIPVDGKGHLDIEELRNMLEEDVLLVSVSLANNEIGTIQNLKEISEVCRDFGVVLHSDFAQAPSGIDLSHFADLADLVSLSGHKFGGPMGIGALYVSRELTSHFEPLIHGGGQEAGMRSGTLPLPLCVGMGAAAEFQSSASGTIERERIADLRNRFVRQLQSISDSVVLNGDELLTRHPSNANLRFRDRDASEMLQRLQPTVSASTGSACSSGITEPSHVLRAIGLSAQDARASIRFSFGHTNTIDDAICAAEAVAALL